MDFVPLFVMNLLRSAGHDLQLEGKLTSSIPLAR
jgi:hypothetical protein